MSVKIVVFAPIPKASDRAATVVNPGAFSNRRAPYLRSCRKSDMRLYYSGSIPPGVRLTLSGTVSPRRTCMSVENVRYPAL